MSIKGGGGGLATLDLCWLSILRSVFPGIATVGGQQVVVDDEGCRREEMSGAPGCRW